MKLYSAIKLFFVAMVMLSLDGMSGATNARADSVEVMGNVGVAPAMHFVSGPFQDAQMLYGGLKIRAFGVVDQDVIQRFKKRVPEKMKGVVAKTKEARISPFWYLPDTVFLSPKVEDSQMYGVAFKPLGLGVSADLGVRLGINGGLLMTYAYLQSDKVLDGKPTHFLRPGLDLNLDIEFPLHEEFLMSLGWTSQVYVPQELGGFGIGERPGKDSLFHIGQAYLMFHFRFPQQITL